VATRERRARIFLSSAQRADSQEREAVQKLAERIRSELGFDVTLGVERSAPHGVPDDVNSRLDAAEYFVLVDFDLTGSPGKEAPGGWNRSLFSHQEFAIAVYLGLDYLVLAEEGLPPSGGVWSYVVREDPVRFRRDNLEETAIAAIRARVEGVHQWNPGWRRGLAIRRRISGSDDHDWVDWLGNNPPLHAKYFLVEVHNEHRDRTATDVYAYLERYRHVESGRSLDLFPIPLKWNAIKPESTSIPPRSTNGFSALYIFREETETARVGINVFLVDSNSYRDQHVIKGEGTYELDLAVYSREFRPSRKRMILRLGSGADDTELIDPGD
jgi:hypothetical protein